MSIQEPLPEISEKIFSKYGITGWNVWNYSQVNLVMGENGAGKSRFLRALRDACIENHVPCVYMDFTQMKGDYTQIKRNKKGTSSLTGTLLFHGTFDTALYHDFIPTLENDTEAFSRQLMQFRSMSPAVPVIGERLENMNAFLDRHLGRRLDFGTDPTQCTLTCREQGRAPIPVEQALREMSPGERCILYFALGILCVQADENMPNNYLILLDEPENHLHPKALRELIEDVKKKETLPSNCALVIASHSIFLIPMFEFEEIIHIQGGAIGRPSGHLYGDLYRSLVGGDSPDGSSLQTFMTSLDSWGFANYIAECLAAEPMVRDNPQAADPQFLKLKEMFWSALQTRKEGDPPVHLLDYGGGSGRIAKCLKLYLDQQGVSLDKKLVYDVYDIELQKDTLPQTPWMGETYSEEGNVPIHTYDFIVLYNVLHEIDITKWAQTLTNMLNMLKSTGLLVFGERNVLSRGERPFGKSGYLVLKLEELKCLFGEKAVEEIPLKLNGRDPTSCYTIRARDADAVTPENVERAVEALSQRMNKAVRQYIDREVASPNSREYAFYCQGKLNAEHALELLRRQGEQTRPAEQKKDSERERTKKLTLNHLINEFSGEERVWLINTRAKINDEEGKRCRNWLKANGYL